MRNPINFLLLIQGALFVIGLGWSLLAGYSLFAKASPLHDGAAFLVIYAALLGLELLFNRLFPSSFKHIETIHKSLGWILRDRGFGPIQALILAAVSGGAEEVFFRGALLGLVLALGGGAWLAVLIQAVVFASFHPVPDKRAWAYPLWALAAGLVLGTGFVLSQSLLPGIMAHYLYNAKGFYMLLDE